MPDTVYLYICINVCLLIHLCTNYQQMYIHKMRFVCGNCFQPAKNIAMVETFPSPAVCHKSSLNHPNPKKHPKIFSFSCPKIHVRTCMHNRWVRRTVIFVTKNAGLFHYKFFHKINDTIALRYFQMENQYLQ